MTTVNEIDVWFDNGIKKDAKFMLIVCDTFAYEDYPFYANTSDECMSKFNNPGAMQRVMEVYDLSADKSDQMQESRAMRLPK
jgi:hypothetical protein